MFVSAVLLMFFRLFSIIVNKQMSDVCFPLVEIRKLQMTFSN